MRTVMLALAVSALIALPAWAHEPGAANSTAKNTAPAAKSSAALNHQADAAQPHQQKTEARQQDEAAHHGNSADPNFRWHSGHWWYWQNGGWLMWNGNRWLNQQDRARVYSNAPRRSFSYMQDAGPTGQGFVPTYDRIPQSDASGLQRSTVAPGTVEYQRVLPSYGRRSAGAKILGNY